MKKQKLTRQLYFNFTVQFLLCFFVIIFFKWQTLYQPPVWDTACSVFPAAIALSQNGFDLPALLSMPRYLEGGPASHANSIVTVLTGVVIFFLGESNFLLPVLHLIHFVIASLGLTVFYRFCTPVLGRKTAVLLTMAVLVFPPFLTQSGYLYLEMPVFLFSVLCLSSWVERRYVSGALFAILATLCKESGVIVAGAIGVAALLQPGLIWKRISRSLSVVVVPGTLVFVSVLAISSQKILEKSASLGDVVQFQLLFRLADTWKYLVNTPDLLLLILVFATAVLLRRRAIINGLTDAAIVGSDADDAVSSRRVSLSVIYSVCFFLFYYLALPLFRDYPMVLVRYYTPAIPFLFLVACWFFREIKANRRFLHGLLMLSIAFSFLNRYGDFYPDEVRWFGNDFSIAERSAGYTDLLQVQKESILFIEQIGKNRPVFFGLPVQHMTSHPLIGYSSSPIEKGECIYLMNGAQAIGLDKLPDCFFMLIISPWLGGRLMEDLYAEAQSNPKYSAVVIKSFTRGNYYSKIVQIKRKEMDCSH